MRIKMSLPNTDSSRWSFSDNQDLSLQCVHACGADGQLNECRMASCGESIYNLIPSEQAVPPRLPRHKSCFPGKLDEKTLVYPMGVAKQPNSKRTFGKPDGMVAPHPQSFTKAHGGHATLPDPQKPERTRDIRKGRTPKRAEKPTMNLHSGKNFITTNAVEAILSHPPKQELEKPYTMKKNFGKVPQYLESNKKMIALEKQQVAEFLKAQHAEVGFILCVSVAAFSPSGISRGPNTSSLVERASASL